MENIEMDNTTAMKCGVIHISPIIDEVFRLMYTAANREDKLCGLPSGFRKIDEITMGWQPASLVIIASRSSMGKSAFATSMACKMAIDKNIHVAMFSLGMNNVEVVKRLMVAVTEIPSEKVKSGRLTAEEWTHFNKCIGRLQNAPIYIDDTPDLSVSALRIRAQQLKAKHDIKCVIVDYLQLMTVDDNQYRSRKDEVALIVRNLKALAKELNITIIVLSQLKRPVECRTSLRGVFDSNRPQLSDLPDTEAIEQDADMVCFIHRPEYYHILDDGKGNSLVGMAQFIIAKHRTGRLDDVLLRFQAELIRFEDVETGAALFNRDEPTAGEATAVPDLSAINEDDTPF